MNTRQISIALPIFVAVFIMQESIVNQFRLPGGGFSIFLIFTITWALMSSPEIAALCGFVAGFLMDLSQSAGGPIGQWTLLMITASYAVAYLGSGNEIMASNPLGFTFFTAVTVLAVEVGYVITGALLGVASGSIGQALITIFGMCLWTLAVTPIVLPIFSRLHAFTFDTQVSK